jgi:hypothetical protein
MKREQQLCLLLYQALAEPIGLAIQTSDPNRLRMQLYNARAKARDPDLAILQFRLSPFEGCDLVIVKTRPEFKTQASLVQGKLRGKASATDLGPEFSLEDL